jgi:CelD/BcsL family acetyltransferase involved in cellulose biosynthesis
VTAATVDDLRGSDAFAFLTVGWDALYAASREPSPFLSREWLSAWAQHFLVGRDVRVLVAREEGAAFGAIALVEEHVRIAGIPTPIRRLTFLGAYDAGPDYLDVLAAEGRELDAAAVLFGHLHASADFDVCILDGLPAESVSIEILDELFEQSARHHYAKTPLFVCPRISLDGPWEAVLARSRRADNFKRRLRKLRSEPGFEWRHTDDAPGALERFLGLHERRWRGVGGSEAMGRPSVRAFHRDVVPALAHAGRLRFEELWVGGACRASIYGLESGGTYAFYQSGFDPDWSGFSVGLVALGLSIEGAIGRGAVVYDFLHGAESYKFDWASTARETVSVRLTRRNLSGTVWRAEKRTRSAARTAAKSLLPDRAVERIRRLRRSRQERE